MEIHGRQGLAEVPAIFADNLRQGYEPARRRAQDSKKRHWDKAKVKHIVSQVASEVGLSASVDPELCEFEYEWFGQQGEHNFEMLDRLQRRHNGLFTIKGGKLIFAKRGSAMSASSAFVGSGVVTPAIIIEGTCSFEANDRRKYSKVVSYYQDKTKAQRVETSADSDADGDSVYRIPKQFASVIAYLDRLPKTRV